MKRKLLVILMISLMVLMCGCHDPKDDIVWSVSYSEGETLPVEAEESMKSFLIDAYYYMAKWEEETDLTTHFAEPTGEYALVCQTAFDMLIEMRSQRDVDLTFECKEVKVEILDVTKSGDVYNIAFEETYTVRFPFMEEDSITQGVECKMAIKAVDGEYKIVSYERIEDFYRIIHEEYTYGSADPQKELDSIKAEVLDEYTKQVEVLVAFKEEVLAEGYTPPTKACSVKINREAAEEYALKYALERNSKWFAYDALGGNCQNFGSQVINAGGVPMDIYGGAQWKHYSTGVNLNNVAQGRTPTWTGVTYFYNYAKKNTGYGLVAEVDANVYTAEAGDILQVGDGDGNFTHTIVALNPIVDEDGNIVDVNTVSNTMDRKNYPLSAYNCPYLRLIKVYGYNK